MTQDQNKKTLRHFQCRDYLWEIFEQMSAELECSTDYLVNEAMRQYARSRNYATSQRPGPETAEYEPGAQPQPAHAQMPGHAMPAAMPAAGPMQAPAQLQGHPQAVAHAPGTGPIPSLRGVDPMTAAQPGAGPLPGGPPGPHSFAPTLAPPARPPTMPPPPRVAAPQQPGRPAVSAPPPLPGAPHGAPPQQGGHVGGQMAVGQMAGSPAPARRLYLIFNGQKIPVLKDEFVIGRGSKSADLPIKDGNISRRHAAIVVHHGVHYIKDLGSTNGVEFHGQRFESRRIEEGDVYRLCDYELQFTFQ